MLVLFEGDNGVKETFRHIERQLGCGWWAWDLQTDQTGWSRGYFDLLGLDPASTTPSFAAIRQVTHPEDRPIHDEIERIIEEASSINRRFRIIRPEGKIAWILCNITVRVDSEGKPVHALGVCIDTTANQAALSPLRVAEDRYRALVKATTSGLIWVARVDGTIREFPNWSEFKSEPVQMARYTRWLDFIHPEDREPTQRAWTDAQQSKQEYFIDHRFLQSDGSYAWRRTYCEPILEPSGQIREWIGISADIHRQKLALVPGSGRLTGAQIRAARGILKWSAEELAEAAGTTRATIRRFEESDGPFATTEPALRAVEEALIAAGVEFLYPEIGKPGVRPR